MKNPKTVLLLSLILITSCNWDKLDEPIAPAPFVSQCSINKSIIEMIVPVLNTESNSLAWQEKIGLLIDINENETIVFAELRAIDQSNIYRIRDTGEVYNQTNSSIYFPDDVLIQYLDQLDWELVFYEL